MRRGDVIYVLLMLGAAVAIMVGCPKEEAAVDPTAPVAVAPEPGAEAPVMAPVEPAAMAPVAPVATPGAQPTPSAAQPAAAASAPAASAPAPSSAPASTPPAATSSPASTSEPAPQPAPSAPADTAPKGTVVIGRITVVSHVPQPSEVPYTDCLTMIKYSVEDVVSGSYGEKELLAAFWGMKAAKLQPAAKFQVGQRHRLTIEPLSDHPDLARAMQADDTNEYSLAPQWVVAYENL